MKPTTKLAILSVSMALGLTANATIIEISLDPNTHLPSDVPFNDIGGDPVSVFGWLEGEILSWNNFVNDPHLPDPTTGHVRLENLEGVGPTIQVETGDYIVMHYGVGPDGVPETGGGLVAYFVTAGQSLTVANNGPGPNGTGGISFVDVWDHNGVPDGGTTLTLLGGALIGLGLIRRRLGC